MPCLALSRSQSDAQRGAQTPNHPHADDVPDVSILKEAPPPREIGSRYIPIPIRAVPRSDGDAIVDWPLDLPREYARESAPLREALGVWSEATLDSC